MKTKTGLLAAVLTLLPLSMAGCWSNATVNSTDINEDTLYGNYSSQYDENTHTLRHYAQLTVGGSTGTTVRLLGPSNLLVDGAPLYIVDGDKQAINISGTYYERESYLSSGAQLASLFAYTWIRNDGSSVSNSVRMPRSVSVTYPQAEQALSRFRSLSVQLSVALEADETAWVTVKSEESLPSGSTMVDSASGYASGGASLLVSDLSKMPRGWATISVEKTLRSYDVQGHPRSGGVLVGKYTTRKLRVYLTD